MQSDVGFVAPPYHYSQQERETIDRMRDVSYVRAREFLGPLATEFEVSRLADSMFAYSCEMNSLKYGDRADFKGQKVSDEGKQRWYTQMAQHVRDRRYPDPRHERPGFQPYRRLP